MAGNRFGLRSALVGSTMLGVLAPGAWHESFAQGAPGPDAFSGPTLNNDGLLVAGNGGPGTTSPNTAGGAGGNGASLSGAGPHLNGPNGNINAGGGGQGAGANADFPGAGGAGGVGVNFNAPGSEFGNAGIVRGGNGGGGGLGQSSPNDPVTGGSGGNGGAGISFAVGVGSFLSNTNTVTGGDGGQGQNAAANLGAGTATGGSGGSGGTGVSFLGTVSGLSNQGQITGGQGGIAGSGSSGTGSADGGNGGNGGTGASFDGSATVLNAGTIAGGAGRAGGFASNLGPVLDGFGGSGGFGLFLGGAANVTNSGTIRGGDGAVSGGATNSSGFGGAAVVVSGGGRVVNTGTIRGGDGGAPPTGGGAILQGDGGVAIGGADVTIVNSGQLIGGLNGLGTAHADAIVFFGGSNRLEIRAGSDITGNVTAPVANNVLAFGGSADQTFDVSSIGPTAQFRAFNRLEKVDGGTTTFTGGSAFAGSTQVFGGRLIVNGDLPNSAVTVQSNATLGGNGMVGGLVVTSTGTVAPGNSIGTLLVNGNVTFQRGSFYQAEVTPTAHDAILASGTATLQGGTVQVLASNATYQPSTRYRILNASGGVTGQFEAVTSNLAFLSPSLSYAANGVDLTLTQSAPFESVALTRNQRGVAEALQATGPNALTGALMSRSPDEARGALNQLSGEAHGSQVSSSSSNYVIAWQVIVAIGLGIYPSERPDADDPRNVEGPTVPTAYASDLPGGRGQMARMPVGGTLDPRVFSMWGAGFGSFGSTSSNGNAGTLTRGAGGFVVGADAIIDGRFKIGLAGGYTRSTFDIRSRLSSGETETGFGAIYGGAALGPVRIRLGAIISGNSTDTRRTVAFPGFSDFLTAQFGGMGYAGFGEVGYNFRAGPATLEPFVGGSVLRLSTDGYTERGGLAALQVFARDYDIQTVTAGLRGAMAFAENSPFTVRGMVGYRAAFGDVVPRALLAFAAGGTQFSTAGIPIDRHAAVLEAGVDWQATQDVKLSLSYTGQVGNRAEDHGIKGGVLWQF